MRDRFIVPASLALILLTALAGCTAHSGQRQAQIAEQYERWDEAVLHYIELNQKHPQNVKFRTGLMRAKIKASQMHFDQARRFQEAGARDRALVEYLQAVQLDPTNQYAQVEYEKLRNEILASERGSSQLTLQEMKDRTHGSRPQPPTLSPRSDEPISLDFPRPVSVMDIYRALGKAFGINILFDPKLRDQELAIGLQDVVAQDALEILMRTANHFYKVLDEQTLIVAEDNPQNRRNYEDLVIQTFFLSNAEVKDVMTMLRSLVGAKNIAANDQLNAIVLRDTVDKVKVAERIIRTNDKARGEVVIEVELLQIDTGKLQELGVSLSDYRVTQSLQPNPIGVSDLRFLNQGNWILQLPSIIYDFVKNSSEAQLLASPQVRISDGEQASLHIGERVPIPVTTFNTAQTVGGNIVPITSFQYQDIGIRLDLEPRLHHNKEISLKLTVEVSNLSGFVPGPGGQQQPVIGTRTIESTIRLKDGETNFLAGMIRTDETNTDTGIPGLSEIPVIGRLFSKKKTEKSRTDLVLTLTPHIVRTPDITEEDLLPIWVGTEANISFRGGSPRVESDVGGPFDDDDDAGAERIREMIRRRIQNLPRGLRDRGGGENDEDEAPPGVELAPAAAPRDLFGPDSGGDGDDGGRPLSLVVLPPLAESPEEPPADPAFAVTAAAAAPPVQLSLLPGSLNVGLGKSFKVRLIARARAEVSHFPITLGFDPRVLSVVEVTEGSLLGQRSEARVLSDASRPGRLVIGASRLGSRSGVTGRGLVAEITFRAEELGVTQVRFVEGKALDAELKEVKPVATRGAQVRVIPVGRSALPQVEIRPDIPLVRTLEGLESGP